MKNIDFRSVIIGVLGSALIFTLYGMRTQDENLGDITVRSIKIIPDKDDFVPFIIFNHNREIGIDFAFTDNGNAIMATHSNDGLKLTEITSTESNAGVITTFRSDGSEVVKISLAEGNGSISTFRRDGSELVTITATEDDDGFISTFRSDGSELVRISSTEENIGFISTYGSDGSEVVKISSAEGNGDISIYNRHHKRVINLQGNKDADGAIYLSDRYGDPGWAESGKQ